MKTLFFECNMGAAGDMLMAALLELHDAPGEFIDRLNSIGIPDVHVTALPSVKCGIKGTHLNVTIKGIEETVHDNSHEHEHEHEHKHSHHNHNHDDEHGHTHDTHEHHSGNGMADIELIIKKLKVSDKVKENALKIYNIIAEAESHVHGVPVTQIHFHEVGAMDAIADIVGVCMLIEELAPEIILASPVHTGSGHVHCAHGILPVPAPATAYILRDIPMYSGSIKGELCTPTGAAVLKYFVGKFVAMPVMSVEKIGYGMGTKDFENANCVRVFLGTTETGVDEVTELACNLDDMTPESIAFAQQILFDNGALDVYTMPIGMKKGRTGILFTCMCRRNTTDKMIALIFKHTTTLGIRETVSRRYTLNRQESEVQTKYGSVRIKTSSGYETVKSKPEYEDIAKIANENGLSISEVLDLLQK